MGRIQLGFYIRHLMRAIKIKEWYLIRREKMNPLIEAYRMASYSGAVCPNADRKDGAMGSISSFPV